MIGCVETELRAMRSGLHDIIPAELLSSLTPEVRRYVTNICRLFFLQKMVSCTLDVKLSASLVRHFLTLWKMRFVSSHNASCWDMF